jgi:hypothetical protein
LSRTLAQLTQISCLFAALGCATTEAPVAPQNVAGSAPTGGSSATNSTAEPSTGGESATGGAGNPTGGAANPTGGAGNPTGGAKAIGGAGPAGGVAATGGASSATLSGVVKLTWTKGATSNDSCEVDVKLPAGADSILASRITLTYCGAGAGALIKSTDLKFDQATLMCPSDVSTGDCTYGSNFPITPAITITGSPQKCCYNLGLGTISHSLVYGTNSMVKLVYRIDSNTAVGINYTYQSTWTVFVDDQASASCTLAEWPSTTIACK